MRSSLRSDEAPLAGFEIGGWNVAQHISEWIEILAVAVIAVAVVAAFVVAGAVWRDRGLGAAVEELKRVNAAGILLGLDLLIAADVIRTVTLEPTLENVGALGLLVLVRTFLAWSLTVELRGRWPWQNPPESV